MRDFNKRDENPLFYQQTPPNVKIKTVRITTKVVNFLEFIAYTSFRTDF
jgi:hypothetical protein